MITQFLCDQPTVNQFPHANHGIKALGNNVDEALAVVCFDAHQRMGGKKLGQHWT